MTLLAQTLLEYRTVAVVDDVKDSRETTADKLRDAGFEAVAVDGKFGNATELADEVQKVADAAVLDHHLNEHNYARCSGAEAAEQLYLRKVPSVVVTKYARADIDDIIRHRRNVPSLLTPEQASTENVLHGFRICTDEFRNVFLPSRRSHRTVVRIDGIDASHRTPIVYAVIPAWKSTEVIRFPMDLIPLGLRDSAKVGDRFFAQVNIGAEAPEEVFLHDFEFKGGIEDPDVRRFTRHS